VVPDREVYAFEQTHPTGIERVGAAINPTAKIDGTDERVDADVAVLDTGIATHSDLNLRGGVSCIPGDASYADGNGHGTHVAGTIGALDNDFGVVGVAPGARLWAVKVLNSQGSGSWSSVICGLNWVAANSGTIDVANMSLGGGGSDSTCFGSDPLHDAICQVVNAGTPVIVAAGNDSMDAAQFVPAAYDEVITVSALADSDGLAGGLGPQTSRGPDDSLATFSNFGADVDIAAPGVSVLSTARGGGYAKFSGTSMASPHVAGAVALYRATYPSATPAQVKVALMSTREPIALLNDPDGMNEGVLNVAGHAPAPLPTVDPAPVSSGETAVPTAIEKKKKDKKKSKHKRGKGAKGNNKSKKKKR
jgi:subtilisin family serine protease